MAMNILLATDGSEGANDAARFLGALPHRPDVTVHILSVRDSSEENEDVSAPIFAAAREALGGFPAAVTTAEAPGAGTSGVVEQILLAADDLPADLIVTGSFGRSVRAVMRHLLLGSVAESVARHAKCPVLMARPLTGGAIDRVLVGLDGSEAAAEAARWLMRQVRLPSRCEVHLLAVVSPPTLFGIGTGVPVPYLTDFVDEALRRGYADAESTLAELKSSLTALVAAGSNAGAGAPEIVTETVGGHPSSMLIDRARTEQIDLLVVGAHGVTSLDRFSLGSVSAAVLRHAPCSVLIVKNGAREHATERASAGAVLAPI